MKKIRKVKSIRNSFIQMTMIPALIIGIILTGISISTLTRNMTTEIGESLSVAAHSVYNAYSLITPGDYAMEDGVLKKGDEIIGGDYTIVDELKKSYHMDITLFYGTERVLTTIMDEDGNRLIGTTADDEVVKWAYEKGRDYFSKNVNICGKRYFGYYVPMLNRDKKVVGMAFAGKPAAEVNNMVTTIAIKSLAVSFAVILATVLMSIVASQRLVESVHAIMEYMGYVSKSDFSQKMSEKAMQRDDEIGEMAKYAAETGKILTKLITTDPLTKLYNRRACGQYLEKRIEKCKKYEENQITVAIGDIDFFKKVNDTYGHDYGDLVLTTLAEKFQAAIDKRDLGIVARWGGEEFLFIIEQPLEQAKKTMQNLLMTIREIEFDYEDRKFSVTMSLGMNGNILEGNFDEIIKAADDLLYQSKENGRDQIRTTDGDIIKLAESNWYEGI